MHLLSPPVARLQTRTRTRTAVRARGLLKTQSPRRLRRRLANARTLHRHRLTVSGGQAATTLARRKWSSRKVARALPARFSIPTEQLEQLPEQWSASDFNLRLPMRTAEPVQVGWN